MRRTFEIWFYIGSLLGFYGLLLTGGGIYQGIHPPSTVLAGKHATFWAGVLLLSVGAAYVLGYWPKAAIDDPHDGSRVE